MKNIIFTLLMLLGITAHAELVVKTNDPIADQIDLIDVEEAKDLELPEDITSRAKNYKSFNARFFIFSSLFEEAKKKRNQQMLCIYAEIIPEFLVNNMEYAEQFNKEMNSPNSYQNLLKIIIKDRLKSEKSCISP